LFRVIAIFFNFVVSCYHNLLMFVVSCYRYLFCACIPVCPQPNQQWS